MKKLQRIIYKKNREYLFVDGYNIINYWEDLRRISLFSLEDAREMLIHKLEEYRAYTGEKIILVYDGYLVKKSPGLIYEENGIIVVYTKEHETADHFIERELDKIGRLRKVRVATSDKIEQQIILSRGGSRISARELEAEVNVINQKIEKKARDLKKSNNKNLNSMDDVYEKLRNLKKNL